MNAEPELPDDKVTTDDLQPGEPCPICGEDIVTWDATQFQNPDEELDEWVCWMRTDSVEPTGLTTNLSGNIVLISH